MAEAGRGEYLTVIYYGEIHLYWGFIGLGEVAPLGYSFLPSLVANCELTWKLLHGYGIFVIRLECWGRCAFSESGPEVQTARNYDIKSNLP